MFVQNARTIPRIPLAGLRQELARERVLEPELAAVLVVVVARAVLVEELELVVLVVVFPL